MGKLAELLSHPSEVAPMLSMYMAARRAKVLPKDPSLAFCYDMLNRVSRSFAVVIQQLPEELRDAVCVFYLVLRALDTVEDDMALPLATKVPLLRRFHRLSYDPAWAMTGCGAGEYVRLMEQYPRVTEVFGRLDPRYQGVVADICRRMGAGMAEYISKDGVPSVAQYDEYCHYVAGLVGIGLSQLFALSGLEAPEFAADEARSNEMGLFLQKTNIIRDYLEDINEEPAPRMWWPEEVWGRYAPSLAALKEPAAAPAALACLNHMVLDALRHVPACLDYMRALRDPAVFRFCAIPQIMAIGTLALCYNNHRVFTGVVKMRRGEVAGVMYSLADYGDTCRHFLRYAAVLRAKAEGATDKNAKAVAAAAREVEASCQAALASFQEEQLRAASGKAASAARLSLAARVLLLLLALAYVAFAWRLPAVRQALGLPGPPGQGLESVDTLNQGLAAALLAAALWAAYSGAAL